MKKVRWLGILMGITILGISGFQAYWLHDNYLREKQNLDIKTNAVFHQTILQQQASKLKLERMSWQFDSVSKRFQGQVVLRDKPRPRPHDSLNHRTSSITILNLLQERARGLGADSGKMNAFILSDKEGFTKSLSLDSPRQFSSGHFDTRIERVDVNADSFHRAEPGGAVTITYRTGGKRNHADSNIFNGTDKFFVEKHEPFISPDEADFHGVPSKMEEKNAVVKFLYDIDSLSLKDSVTVKEVKDAYLTRLREERLQGIDFSVQRLDSNHTNSKEPNEVTIGFTKPLAYRLSLNNEFSYVIKKITLPILFSVLLVGLSILSFILLYRNLSRQKRLGELKNEFISNITHELKTPIATVGVAIEALKNFNAIHDPERTREYLDISQNELQRLSMLVDKVLKLSMFEKREMELKKEQFDCKQLTEEVINSMRLQFDKYHALVKLVVEGDNFVVEADKLHITSVIYNLLDNALKYSRENPVITVHLTAKPEQIQFSVSDNGIGIPAAYQEKVFDKFFRVPTGDKHNIKGYGLGLSYVSEVMKRHRGTVQVHSELGKGSTFTAQFPYV